MRLPYIILLFLFSIFVSGQQSLEHYNINTDLGLSNRNVSFAMRDWQGFLWIVNSEIEKFDGYRFTRFSKAHPTNSLSITNLNSAIALGDTAFLACNGKELIHFNCKSEESHIVNYLDHVVASGYNIDKIYKSNGNPFTLVFLSGLPKSLLQVYDEDWELYSEFQSETNSSLYEELERSYSINDKGTLFVLDRELRSVFAVDGNKIKPISYRNIDLSPDIPHRIIHHNDLGLLIVGENGKIFKLNENDVFSEYYDFSNSYSGLKSLHIDRNGILQAIYQNGLVFINFDTKKSIKFNQDIFSGKNPEIHYLFDDEEGISWLCSEIGLIKVHRRINPFFATTFSPPEVRNIQYRDIFLLDSTSLVTRLAQIRTHIVKFKFHQDGKVDTTYLFKDIGGSGILQFYKGDLLYTEYNSDKLLFYPTDERSIREIVLPYPTSASFRNLSLLEGEIYHYVNRDNNLVKFNLSDQTYELLILENKPSSASYISKFLLKTSDGLYLNGGEYGLYINDAETGRFIGKFTLETHPDLLSEHFNCIVQYTDNIFWVGTLGGGLYKIDIVNNSIQNYSTYDGLPDENIASIVKDAKGYLWIGTYDGLARFNPETGEFHTFTTNDGLPNNEFNYLSSLVTDDGEIYLGTFNGLLKFRPDQIFSTKSLPEVSITSVSKFNQNQNEIKTLHATDYSLNELTILPSDIYTNIEFAVPSYLGIGNFNFEIRLFDLEKQWQNIGGNASIRYQKLPAGEYTFQVRASDSKGRKTPEPTVMKLVVLQPFYKTWWFFAGIAALVIGILYILYKYRIDLIQKESRTRARIAADLHDEIGSSLTRVSMQLQLLEPRLKGSSKNTIQKLNRLIDNAISQVRDLVWSIDMKSDLWKDMLDRMRDYSFDTLGPRNINFLLEEGVIPPEKVIGPLLKRNLFLIFKESIHNIARHSNANAVTVKFKSENGFIMIIQDNGVQEGTNGIGNGLSSMANRANKMGGSIQYGYNEIGFEVKLVIPDGL